MFSILQSLWHTIYIYLLANGYRRWPVGRPYRVLQYVIIAGRFRWFCRALRDIADPNFLDEAVALRCDGCPHGCMDGKGSDVCLVAEGSCWGAAKWGHVCGVFANKPLLLLLLPQVCMAWRVARRRSATTATSTCHTTFTARSSSSHSGSHRVRLQLRRGPAEAEFEFAETEKETKRDRERDRGSGTEAALYVL